MKNKNLVERLGEPLFVMNTTDKKSKYNPFEINKKDIAALKKYLRNKEELEKDTGKYKKRSKIQFCYTSI